MEQEALRKIITTLAVKNEEIQSFIYSLKQMLLNVEVRRRRAEVRDVRGRPVAACTRPRCLGQGLSFPVLIPGL